MKSIKVKYFAMLREKVGKSEEEMQVSLATYAELYEKLSEQYSFELPGDMIQVAVNDEFSSLKSLIVDGAQVVFIPPVAGG